MSLTSLEITAADCSTATIINYNKYLELELSRNYCRRLLHGYGFEMKITQDGGFVSKLLPQIAPRLLKAGWEIGNAEKSLEITAADCSTATRGFKFYRCRARRLEITAADCSTATSTEIM